MQESKPGEMEQWPAPSGNASNPAPQPGDAQPTSSQLLDKHAEKYLRESANIEDMPDAQEQADADETGANRDPE